MGLISELRSNPESLTFKPKPQRPTPNSQPLLPHIFFQCARPDFRAVDIALRISCDSFGGAGTGGIWVRLGVRNECGDLTVFRASDSYASLPPCVAILVRLPISRMQNIITDVEPAYPAELRPLVKELTILIEDLNPIVVAIGNEQASS